MMLKVIEAGTLCRSLKTLLSTECSDHREIAPEALIIIVEDLRHDKNSHGTEHYKGKILYKNRLISVLIQTTLSLEKILKVIEVENECD